MKAILLYLVISGCTDGRVKIGDNDGNPPEEDTAVTDTGELDDTGLPDDVEPGDELTTTFVMGGGMHSLFGLALDEGDIDGDLRDDLLVGAPGVQRDEDYATSGLMGEVWLFHGPILPDSHPRSTHFSGIAANDAVGTAIAHGDFNRDGVNDVAVSGGMANPDNPSASGFVSVVYGPFSDEVALSRGSMLERGGVDDAFGASLLVSDFTSDDYDDLVVGGPQGDVREWEADAGRGVLYIYGGSIGGLTNSELAMSIVGDTEGGRFGEALATGDANGDGVDDLLVGAPRADGVEEGAGAAYLFHGPFNDTEGYRVAEDAETTFNGGRTGDELGTSLDMDDLDNDGIADIMIGAPGNDDEGLDAGAVGVFYSSAATNAMLYGEQPGSRAGSSVRFAHDMNSDGSFDLVVGAPKYDAENVTDIVDAGRAYLVLGPVNGRRALEGSDHVTGSTTNMRLGLTVLGDTELIGDDTADVVLAGPSTSYPEAETSGIIQFLAGY